MVVMDYVGNNYEELDDAWLNLSNSTHKSLVHKNMRQSGISACHRVCLG